VKRFLTVLAAGALALPLVACGGGGGGGDSSDGIVGRLTGDPDDEVTSQLEKLVEKAVARTTSDEPIPD
jgi:hypothetical protein